MGEEVEIVGFAACSKSSDLSISPGGEEWGTIGSVWVWVEAQNV